MKPKDQIINDIGKMRWDIGDRVYAVVESSIKVVRVPDDESMNWRKSDRKAHANLRRANEIYRRSIR